MKNLFLVAMMFLLTTPEQRDGAASRLTTGNGSIRGIALDTTDSSRPIRRALVTLSGAGLPSRMIQTDDSGRFAFDHLPVGRFYLAAEKAGYVKYFFQPLAPALPPGRAISLALGESRELSLEMQRGAVISGTIRSQRGEPLIGAQVRVYRSVPSLSGDSKRRLVELSLGPYQTDERGTYRFYGLPPGEYVIDVIGGGAGSAGDTKTVTQGLDAVFRALGSADASAPALSERLVSETVTRGVSFYPGVTDMLDAQVIVATAGSIRSDVDIICPLVRTASVHGTVRVDGAAPSSVALGLVSLSRSKIHTSLGAISTTADGRFEVKGLTPGKWRLFARTRGDAQRQLFGQVEFTTDGRDTDGVVVPMRAGTKVIGKVVATNDTRRSLGGVRLRLTDTMRVSGEEVSIPVVTTDETGLFTFPQVPSGDFRLSVEAASGLYLDGLVANSVTADTIIHVPEDQDVDHIEVRLTDKPTELVGRLLSETSSVEDLCAIVFPVDPNLRAASTLRRAGPVRLESDGSFRFVGLPAGDYYLSIVGWLEPLLLDESAVLNALVDAAVRVTLEKGRQTKQDLRVK